MSKILVKINFFGPYLKKDEVLKILDPKFADTIFQKTKTGTATIV